ncbi:putative membrane protein [Clostridioides difficile P30]|nr:putative membrane protein [Clostridioides difficile P30]
MINFIIGVISSICVTISSNYIYDNFLTLFCWLYRKWFRI